MTGKKITKAGQLNLALSKNQRCIVKKVGFYKPIERVRWDSKQLITTIYKQIRRTGSQVFDAQVAELPPPPMGGMSGMGGPPVPRQQLWPTPQY